MIQIIEMTDEEKLEMYRKSCTFDELAKMHIELERHIPKPKAKSSVDPQVKSVNDVIKIIDEFIEGDKKFAETFDNDDWQCSIRYKEEYRSRLTIVLNELKNRLSA